MLCLWLHRCDLERVWNGSRQTPYQTLSIECPPSVFFLHMLFVIVPFFFFFFFFFSFLFCFHALIGALQVFLSYFSVLQTMYRIGNHVQWRLRFKITVCHTEENYLKHVTLLNRFKIVFLLNRDIGLRETYLKPNIWVLESPGLGSRALKGQAVAVAPNRSVESAFRNI